MFGVVSSRLQRAAWHRGASPDRRVVGRKIGRERVAARDIGIAGQWITLIIFVAVDNALDINNLWSGVSPGITTPKCLHKLLAVGNGKHLIMSSSCTASGTALG